MTIDIDYLKKYINYNGSNKDYIGDMSDKLSTQRNNAISQFQIQINSNLAESIILNSITYKSIIKDQKDSLAKIIQMNQGIMKYGDYITYQNETYLVTSKVESKDLDYDISNILVCNSKLRFKAIVNNVEEIIEIPSIINKGVLSVTENKYFDTMDNQLTCTIGYSEINKINYIKSTENPTRFVLGGKTWFTKGIDNISNMINSTSTTEKQGTITIKLESDLLMAEDRLDLELAYNPLENIIVIPPDPIPTSTLYSISGSETLTSTSVTVRYEIVDSNGVFSATTPYTFTTIKYDANTPINLFTVVGSGTNYMEIRRKTGMSGQFILRAKLASDNTIYTDKLITVG